MQERDFGRSLRRAGFPIAILNWQDRRWTEHWTWPNFSHYFSAEISRWLSQRSKKLPENFYSKCSSVHTAAWEHCKSATVISLKVGFKLPPSFSSLLFSGALISVYFFVSFNFCAVRLWANWALLTRWSFFNYVGQILPIIDHLPCTYPLLTLVREFLYIIYKGNSWYCWHFIQYPLPHLSKRS